MVHSFSSIFITICGIECDTLSVLINCLCWGASRLAVKNIKSLLNGDDGINFYSKPFLRRSAVVMLEVKTKVTNCRDKLCHNSELRHQREAFDLNFVIGILRIRRNAAIFARYAYVKLKLVFFDVS